MDLGLSGRACAVTGASRGIGRETALQLCAEGAAVLLVARDEERLREVQEEAVGAGAKAGGRAGGGEPLRDLAADAAAGAGDQRLATGKAEEFSRLCGQALPPITDHRRDVSRECTG